MEALTPEFGQVFWDFVKEGGYENRQKSGGKPQFYRFSKPEDPAFPAMLELFARTDVDLRDAESGLMPIHIDDEVSSLSAILLDEEYYRLLVENRTSAGGVAVLSVEGLIPFKAKAWLDLSARRAGGQAVDEKSVKKHRNDVCRLATLLAGGERPAMSEGVRADMRRFLEAYESDPVDPKALKIKGVGAQQVVEVLKSVYLRQRSCPMALPSRTGRKAHPASFIADYLRHTAATGYLPSSYWALLSSPAGCEG